MANVWAQENAVQDIRSSRETYTVDHIVVAEICT